MKVPSILNMRISRYVPCLVGHLSQRTFIASFISLIKMRLNYFPISLTTVLHSKPSAIINLYYNHNLFCTLYNYNLYSTAS